MPICLITTEWPRNAMLSAEEIRIGIPFVLILPESGGAMRYFAEHLRGSMAKHWYVIDARSDWTSLRRQALHVFRKSVSERDAMRLQRTSRCVVICPNGVTVEDLDESAVHTD